jgi:histidine triad (HIT) family protein
MDVVSRPDDAARQFADAPPDYECPFCAVVQGEDRPPWTMQSDVVYRDAATTAWVSGRWWENNPGHVLVIPNRHVENIFGIERDLGGAIHETARLVALAMKAAYRCDGISTRQHNGQGADQEVWHYHLHVFPRYVGDDLYRSEARLVPSEERAPCADRLRAALP